MILTICGTNRPDAQTRIVSKYVHQQVERCVSSDKTGAKLLDLADLKPEIFEPKCYATKPAWFKENFQAPIHAASGIIVLTPEYNGTFPGVLKYFIDMLEFPSSLVGVPCAFIGCAAGMFGALRAVEQLELVFGYRRTPIFGDRVFIPDINSAIESGKISESYTKRLDALVTGFVAFSRSVSKSKG